MKIIQSKERKQKNEMLKIEEAFNKKSKKFKATMYVSCDTGNYEIKISERGFLTYFTTLEKKGKEWQIEWDGNHDEELEKEMIIEFEKHTKQKVTVIRQ